MRTLNLISIGMTIAGIALAVMAQVADLQPVYVLTGVMVAWAGIVKIVVVHLWKRVAGLGTDRHDPIPPV